MDKGTVIYYGGFALPDKSASANRVVANGKLFSLLGLNTVFLGVSDEAEEPVTEISDNMFVQPKAKSVKQWFRRMTDTSPVTGLIDKFPGVRTVVLYNTPFLTLLRFKRKLRKSNTELVYDCTEWTGDTDGGTVKRVFKKADEFFIRNFAASAADKMIVISSVMEKKYGAKAPTLRLPPLVDTQDGIWRQEPERDGEAFEFCFAGVPDGKKESLDAVINAFSMLGEQNTRLRIVGVTAEQMTELYPELNIPQNVIFSGFVPHSQAVGYILSCDCYIFIRQSDRRNNAGFPTKFAESYTAGAPIITTDVSDVAGYINDIGDGCILPSIDEKQICEAMRKQLKRGRQPHKLRDDFDFRSYIDKTAEWLGM